MYITYCKSSAIKYATRNRYKSLPTLIQADANTQLEDGYYRSEIQRRVLLGDGVNTSVKTSSLNICDYVLIAKDGEDNNPTRWFVVLFNYLNGGQIELQLRRDVIGEFGILNMVGKIERGYIPNNNILINRKELSVNEILKERKHLLPDSDIFGNYSIVSRSGEKDDDLWGILYFSKQQETDNFTVDIPEFTNVNLSLPFENNLTGAFFNSDFTETYKGVRVEFYFSVICQEAGFSPSRYYFKGVINFTPTNSGYKYNFYYDGFGVARPSAYNFWLINLKENNVDVYLPIDKLSDFCNGFIDKVASSFIDKSFQDSALNTLKFPSISGYDLIENADEINRYNNQYIKDVSSGTYYRATVSSSNVYISGNEGSTLVNNAAILAVSGYSFIFDNQGITHTYSVVLDVIQGEEPTITTSSIVKLDILQVNYTSVSIDDVNSISLSYQGDILDEPFFTMAIPLFSCNISNLYNVSKENAVYAFNSIIKNLSGETGYIIDAQIVSYCPDLKSVVELKKKNNNQIEYIIPLFYLKSSSYERDCSVAFSFKDNPLGIGQINVNKKKEYSKRNFSIVSPEQSGKYIFNFYDYVRPSYTENDTQTVVFKVKIALKPYSLIASCVIDRIKDVDVDPLQGITYNSDLRGCQPNSGGFQASLASNAFQEYKRQNSNYQQIFNKQQERLYREHWVERGNEAVQGVMNTLSMTAMGAIAGAQMASVQILGTDVSKAAGAAVGAGVAGGITAAANAAQFAINESMRQYEYSYNQEMFDYNIGTIKNLPDSVNRISSFNEIILKDFWFTLELYECSPEENLLIDTFFEKYGYEVGVYGEFSSYLAGGDENVFFLKGRLLTSNLGINLHNVAQKELEGGIYYINEE